MILYFFRWTNFTPDTVIIYIYKAADNLVLQQRIVVHSLKYDKQINKAIETV